MVAAPAKSRAAVPPRSLSSFRPALMILAVIVGLTVVFWFAGPPYFFQTPAAQIVRLIYAVPVLVCVWRLASALKMASGWRWTTLIVVALVLKANLFPLYFRSLNFFSPGSILAPVLSILLGTLVGLAPLFALAALFGAVAWAVWLLSRRHRAVVATGYRSPVDWTYAEKGGMEETHVSLITTAVLEERAALPPFMLWYHQSQYKAHANPDADRWLSVMDGNPSLAGAGGDLPTYIQIHDAVPGFPAGSRAGRLSLFRVATQVIEDITRGPLRKARVLAVRHPDGQSVTLTIPAGAAGAPMPRAPAPVSIIHGAGGEGSGDTDAERA